MIISFLVGYAIGYAIGCIITEICIRISSYWNAKEEIKRKASSEINKPVAVFEVFLKKQGTKVDEEELEIKALDSNNNEIAKIKVIAENGTNLRVGQRFY